MFQPQPTPFASSSFASYGLASDVGFGYQVPNGGGGVGPRTELLYSSQLPLEVPQPSQSQPQRQQHQRNRNFNHNNHLHHHHLPSQPQSSFAQPQSHPQYDPPTSLSSVSPITLGYGSSTHPHPHLLPQPVSLSTSQPHPHHQQQHYNPPIKMEDDQGQHGMAAQQAAAKDYQPEHKGPRVGDKIPCDAITQEFSGADSIYVEKTTALPQTYAFYRPILGDGNCGWRSIGFSYVEKLIDSGDQNKIEGEVARLMSFSPMLASVGGYEYSEDFMDTLIEHLREVASNMGNPSAAHLIARRDWNGDFVSDSMVYALRLLAGTYIKANQGTYEPFTIEQGGIHGYCAHTIEIVNKEIEQLGIDALYNILLKPADFILEIAYLDRSPGTHVNSYRFPEANSQEPPPQGPTIYLLYRPDHYDILYREPSAFPARAPAAPVSIPVNRVNSISQHNGFTSTYESSDNFASADFGILSMIPGLSMSTMRDMSSLGSPSTVHSFSDPFAPTPTSPWMSQFPDNVPAVTPQAQAQPQPPRQSVMAPSPTPSVPLSPAGAPGSSSSSMISNPAFRRRPSVPSKPNVSPSPEYQIRFSPVQLEYDGSKGGMPDPPFQVTTNTFKNSVWNRAHYGNPDFHPEEWSPEDENIDGRIGGKRRIKKET